MVPKWAHSQNWNNPKHSRIRNIPRIGTFPELEHSKIETIVENGDNHKIEHAEHGNIPKIGTFPMLEHSQNFDMPTDDEPPCTNLPTYLSYLPTAGTEAASTEAASTEVASTEAASTEAHGRPDRQRLPAGARWHWGLPRALAPVAGARKVSNLCPPSVG